MLQKSCEDFMKIVNFVVDTMDNFYISCNYGGINIKLYIIKYRF